MACCVLLFLQKMTTVDGQKYAHFGRFIAQNDGNVGINWVIKLYLVKYHKNMAVCAFLETLLLVNMNKVLSKGKISVACDRD